MIGLKIFKNTFFLFLILSVLITAILFRGGELLGSGESGVPFYNLKRMLQISDSPWNDALLGIYVPHVVANIPFFAALSFLQNIGIPGYLLQATFFFLLIFLSISSMYLLSKELFPKASKWSWILAALFYLFNLYSLMNIWNRYLLNFMLFYAILPLILYLFLRGLKVRSYTYAFLTAFLTALFSYSLSAPSHLLVLWFLILIAAVFYLIYFKTRFTIGYFLLTLFLSMTFNFWWISQQFYFNYSKAFKSISSSFFTLSGNQEAFNALSHTLGQLSNLFLLKHGTFFTQPQNLPFNWPLIYGHPLALIIEWTVALSTLYFAIKHSRDIWVRFLLCLFLIGIFISKGNSDPLGEVFDFLFKKVSLLQFFRNPFEKLGILLPLAFSPLFGLAMVYYLNRKLVITFLILYLFVFLGFPFFTGLVFTNGHPTSDDLRINYEVKIPDYYKEANSYLSSQKDIFRFISFPLGGEGIFNKWPKGYVGLEQSALLFSTPSISYNVGFPYYNEIAGDLERIFRTYNDFYKAASLLNVKYILLRADFDYKLSEMRDPRTIEKTLEGRIASPEAKLAFASSFGPLKFYNFSDDVFLPRIYVSKGFISTNKVANLEDFWFGQGKLGEILVEIQRNKNLPSQKSVIHNQAHFFVKGPHEFEYTDEPTILPFTDRLSTSRLYKLILLSERLINFANFNPKLKTEYEILLLGKRLVESKKAIDKKNYRAAKESLLLYQQQLPRVIRLIRDLSFDRASKQPVWEPEFLKKVFGTHIILLEESAKQIKDPVLTTEILKVRDLILNSSSLIFIFPKYHPLSGNDFLINNRQIYQFKFIEEGEYELIIPEPNLEEYFKIPKVLKIQVDNNLFERQVEITKDGYISLGRFYLKNGIHEIGFNLPETKNLVEVSPEIKVESMHGREEVSFPIKSFSPDTLYSIALSYYIQSGKSPFVAFGQNIDNTILEKGKSKTLRTLEIKLPQDDYWFDFRKFEIGVSSSKSADSGQLIFYIDPWNDCLRLLEYAPEKCEETGLRESFDRKTNIVLKDIKLTRFQTRAPVLRMTIQDNSTQPEPLPYTSFTKVNKTKYLVSIKNATSPFFLVFSELYDNEWKAYFVEDSGKKKLPENNHMLVNGYANGWWIDKTGDFEIILEFLPQKLLHWGSLVSIITIILTSGYFALKYSRNKYES